MVIAAAVQEERRVFQERWNSLLEVSPVLLLDGSWPSVGVLDLMTYSLRLAPELTIEGQRLLKGAAAYIACLIHDAWSNAAVETELTDSAGGISITAYGGSLFPAGGVISINIETELEKCLKELPSPFAVTNEIYVPISFESNLVSFFALAVAFGRTPLFAGLLGSDKDSPVCPLWECRITDWIAKSCADYYARVYPFEPVGALPELYASGMVFPPLLTDKGCIFNATTDRMISFLSQQGFSLEDLRQAAKNLVQNPDENISCFGLALYAVVCDEYPAPAVIAAVQAKKRIMGLLRNPVVHMRERLQLGSDWVIAGLNSAEERKRFEIEEALRLVPWLSLSCARIEADNRQKRLQPFLKALCLFDMEEASRVLDVLLVEFPEDSELLLQKADLLLIRGEKKKAQELCEAISEKANCGGARFYKTWGVCALALGDYQAAVEHLKAGILLNEAESTLEGELLNNYAWALVQSGHQEAALEVLDLALKSNQSAVTPLLNKGHILWKMGRFTEVSKLRKTLFELAPTDRRVFATLFLESGV
ncbi:MAG TPA: tetratricopeptide repeat protein [Oligoflexia bacterium]|nr:tetratricopeptide repeat protein [Oligoflexia bacterium]